MTVLVAHQLCHSMDAIGPSAFPGGSSTRPQLDDRSSRAAQAGTDPAAVGQHMLLTGHVQSSHSHMIPPEIMFEFEALSVCSAVAFHIAGGCSAVIPRMSHPVHPGYTMLLVLLMMGW